MADHAATRHATEQYAVDGGAMAQMAANVVAAHRAAKEYAEAVPKSVVEGMIAAHQHFTEQYAAYEEALGSRLDSMRESLTAAQRAADQLAAFKVEFIPPSW